MKFLGGCTFTYPSQPVEGEGIFAPQGTPIKLIQVGAAEACINLVGLPRTVVPGGPVRTHRPNWYRFAAHIGTCRFRNILGYGARLLSPGPNRQSKLGQRRHMLDVSIPAVPRIRLGRPEFRVTVSASTGGQRDNPVSRPDNHTRLLCSQDRLHAA